MTSASGTVTEIGGLDAWRSRVRPVVSNGARTLGRTLAHGAWSIASWLVAALLSFSIVAVIVTGILPAALTTLASTFPFGSAQGSATVALLAAVIVGVVVVTGFACWAGVVIINRVWRWRRRLMDSVTSIPRTADPALGTAERVEAKSATSASQNSRRRGGRDNAKPGRTK